MTPKKDASALHRTWLAKALALAHKPSEKGGSPHPTVKVAALFVSPEGKVISQAVNRFARRIDSRKDERFRDGFRSLWINCAEQMALAQAVREGKSLKGATLYVTLEPCAVCSGILAESGIKKIVVPLASRALYEKLKVKWKDSMDVGREKLKEAGVKVFFVDMNGG